jgi:hypothetical protein
LSDILRSIADAFALGSCASVLRFDGSSLTVTGGKLSSRTRGEIESVLRDAGCPKGTIRIGQDGRATFHHIDASLHQQLRNLLANR